MLPQLAKLLVAFLQYIFCCAVGGDPADMGEQFTDFVQNGNQIRCFYNNGIAVRQKHPIKPIIGVVVLDPLKVGNHFRKFPDAELFAFVHGTETACVPGATNCELNDQTLRFAGWTINIAFVNHTVSPFILRYKRFCRLR